MGIRLKGQTTGYVEIEAPATAADNTLTLPNGNGSSNQVLTTDGSGGLTFAAPQLSTDTTPQLGGDLDVNGNDIVTTSNGDIDLDPNGSGQVVFKGNATRGSGAVKLNCENNSHGILVKGPPHSAGANYTLTLPNDTGTSGQLLSTNGSGVTSWTNVEASPTYQATASGAIANGDTCIVKSDGKVAAVSSTVSVISTLTTSSVSDPYSEVSAGHAGTFDFLSGRCITFARRQSSNAMIARAIKLNGTSFDKGDEVTISSSSFPGNNWNTIVYDELNQRTVFVYVDDNNKLMARVATVSADDGSMLLGPLTTLVSSSVDKARIQAAYDKGNGKVVIAHRHSSTPKVIVCTVDGGNNTITAGTAVQAITSAGNRNMIAYDDSTGKLVHFYTSASSTLACKVFTVSGTGGSYGTEDTVSGSTPDRGQAVYDASAEKVVLYYRDTADTSKGKAVAVSISGTTPTFGTPAVFTTAELQCVNAAYDPDSQKTFAVYTENTGDDGDCVRGTISSGTTITFDTPVEVHDSAGPISHAVVYDYYANKGFFTCKDVAGNGTAGGMINMSTVSTNLTRANYIGIANAAYADGATATIQVVGSIDDAQSSLIPGREYFVQQDGSLEEYEDYPAVSAGTAVSATKLIVKG